MPHLAQVNLAWMRYPLEDPRMAGGRRRAPTPTVEDAMAPLERLWRDGSTPEAFTLAEPYSPDGLAIDPAWTASTPANQ